MNAPHSAVIIGSGFGGIGTAIRLRQAGVRDFVVLEKAGELGGTWRDNTYPGAACDVPSHLYSFSFEPGSWSRRYPEQGEILAYLRHCARKYGVLPHLRFGTEATGARFDEEAGLWRVSTTGGELSARVLVAACGQLNRPALPPIEGRETFAGTSFHSARWDHSFDPSGRRVAVIGTGASAIQFVPELARTAGRLHVFQRSAPWVLPKPDRAYRDWERSLEAALPVVHRLRRARVYTLLELRALGMFRYPRLLETATRRFRSALREHVADPVLRARLTPDYPIGCKRIMISDDYLPALARPNVELVTDPIARIVPEGIVTAAGGTREVDAIVYGTGFAAGEFLAPMKITGLAGRELSDAWKDGPTAHLGITVSGFPNLFLLYGPYTNLGHNSIIYMLESQIRYAVGCVRALDRYGLAWMDVRPEVHEEFEREMQRRMRRTVWDRGCTSWYKSADGRVANNWPGFTFAYRRATRRPDPRHFRLRAGAGPRGRSPQ